jgi:hypothetical protein
MKLLRSSQRRTCFASEVVHSARTLEDLLLHLRYTPVASAINARQQR